MSYQAQTWVAKYSEAKGLERQVIGALANHANGAEPPWLSWISVGTITYECRASRKGVQKALIRMKAAGRLLDTGRRVEGSVVYEICVDAEVDAIDREARLRREAAEARRHGQAAANQVRPDGHAPSGELSTPQPGEPGTPDGGELSTPPAGEPGSPTGGVPQVPGGERRVPDETPSTPEPNNHQEPTAAKAAAPRAHAPRVPAPAHEAGPVAGTGSSSTGTAVEVSDFWDRAAAALEVAGFAGKVIGSARLQILDRLRRSHIPLGDIVWPLLGPQLKVWREDPAVHATKPEEVLAFALQQRGDVTFTTTTRPRPAAAVPGRPTAGPPTAAAAQNAAVNDRLVLPDPTEGAARAWRDVVDGLEASPKWPELERDLAGILGAVHPLQLLGNVLEISASQAGAYLVEQRVVRVADRYADEHLNGHVRWVPRDEAAARTTGRAAA